MSSRTAACSCGQLSITVHGETGGTGICHCFNCQARTGSAFAFLAGFTGPYEVRGNATEYVFTGDAGAKFRFRFCPTCGSTVFHTEEGVEGHVSVAVGCFRDPSFATPGDSVYTCRKHAWVQLPEGCTAFDKDPV